MLERVPATAESAAHVFLRNVERPQRSTRLLDPRFWQHECDQLVPARTSAAWWPQYLQRIRQIPQENNSTHPSRHVTPPSWKRSIRNTPVTRRSYSRGAPLRSAEPAPKNEIYDLFGLTETIEVEKDEDDKQEDGSESPENGEDDGSAVEDIKATLPIRTAQKKSIEDPADADGFSPFGAAKKLKPILSPEEQRQRRIEIQEARKAESWKALHPDKAAATSVSNADKFLVLNHLLTLDETRPSSEERLNQIWQLFIALPDQTVLAQQVFHRLARRRSPSLMTRASAVFDLIPVETRNTQDYEQAIILRLAQDHIQAAIALAEETVDGQPRRHIVFLCTQLVRRSLWNNLSGALRAGRYQRDQSLFAGCIDIHDLPERILQLHERIEEGDEVLEDPLTLRSVVSLLTRVCMRSEAIMRTISSDTLIALLRLPRYENKEIHTLALATLSREGVRAGKKDIALAVYRDFLSSDSSHLISPATLGSLLSACGQSGHMPDVYKYILDEFDTRLGKPDLISYLLVLTLCARQGSVSAVQSFYKRFLIDHTAPPDIRYVSPLIHVCARTGNRDLAIKYFDDISSKYGFKQDVHCWNMLMTAYARSEPTTEAFDIFGRMVEAGVQPDSYSYGILMAVCADLEDPESVERLLEQAREEGISVTVPMIDTLVDAYLTQDKWDIARQFVITLSESDASESLTRPWNSLLRYCAMKGFLNKLTKTRDDMQRYGIKPDSWTYATMIMSLTLAKRTPEALEYFRNLVNKNQLIALPLHYSIILHGLILERRWGQASSILKELLARFENFNTDAKQALFAKISQKTVSDADGAETISLDLMTSVFEDLDTSQKDNPPLKTGEPVDLSMDTPAQTYINIFLHAMRRNKQISSAEQLTERLERTGQLGVKGSRQFRRRFVQLFTLKMDSALAQSDWKAVENFWAELFEKYSSRPRSASYLVKNSENQPKPSLSESEVFSLSKPFNRYMQAMLRQKKQHRMVKEIQLFEAAGYKLSGVNWNKYVQVLARSTSSNYRIAAFKMVELNMKNRAQSWDLLQRGLLRTENKSYSFEETSPNKPRPVLQKTKTYSLTDRLSALYRNPARKIPTYVTMVHLAAILQFAQNRAAKGDVEFLGYINTVAKQTKRFVERMPKLNDNVQNELLNLNNPEVVERALARFRLQSVAEPTSNEQSVADQNAVFVKRMLERPERRRLAAEWSTFSDVGHNLSGPVRPVRSIRPYALPYMERRRLRDELASHQRREAEKYIGLQGDQRMLAASSAAGRRIKMRETNVERLSGLLDNIKASGRPTIAPLPKTRTGYRRRRRIGGPAAVRFVADLNRSKRRYAVRRGLIPETKQGLAKVNQSKYLVSKDAKHLLLRRASRPRVTNMPVRNFVRGKVPRERYLIRVGRRSGRVRAEQVVGRRKALMAGVRKALQDEPAQNTSDAGELTDWQPLV